ncbi:MAG TPA: SPOR domain-containing protein [Solirubrobacterales bacterium]|nr:SPOR domain-containing protein [Solirubrobacterales bacterium]
MNRVGLGGDSGGAARECASCGQALAPGAAFCRSCGAKYEAKPVGSATVPRPPGPRSPSSPRRSRTAIWAGGAIVLAGAGAALAILLSSGGGSSNTTVLLNGSEKTATAANAAETTSESAEQSAAGSIEAGRYVQAGSFKSVPHAETERERLAAAGIDVRVVSSDTAEEFYPGFQVLVGGPFRSGAQETSMIKALHGAGVPSAFARDLSPAVEIGDPAAIAGRWSGVLNRSSGEHPNLDGSLPVSLEVDSDGNTAALEFEDGCRDELTLAETTATTLAYSQGRPCAAGGDLLVRPTSGQLMLSLLPFDSDALVLGSLSPG